MKPLKKIVVLGGGTAGWLSAALLANQISKAYCKITLVESELIGSIGVGESTVPPFTHMLNVLGIDEADFMRKTQASFKLGIEFQDWQAAGTTFFHPFGKITAGLDESSLYQYWLRSALSGDAIPFQALSACSVLAKNKRFVHHRSVQGSPLAEARHALHLDATLAAKYLRDYAEKKGVQRIEGKVERVVSKGDEKILALVLGNGKKIAADFFIDCSGFQALLLGKTLNVGYEDWSKYLPCNRAVTLMSEALKNTPPYTKATAQQAGWIWRIPLQNRAGNGYVYVAEQCSDDEATATLLKAINTKPTSEAKFVPFKTGMRKQCWKGNCIAVGLAAGFIEPLESTAIHLAMRGAAEFLQQLPNTACSPALIKEYNRKIRQDYEEVRDFIILHYSASQRGGSELWNYCANMPLPDSLLEKLEYFKALGNVPYANFPLFEGTSWRSLCEGMQIRPQHYSMLIEPMDYKTIKAHMMSYKKALQSLALKAPSHDEFLRQYCASPQPATG